ncbi:MAG TPA: alanine--tRNA ligase [Porticoccaceae bacterium]|nr:alanine--tRNA ligase [Porticoccaceae bacterium]
MKSADIRQSFLDFFAGKGHQVVPSSSLVPGNDPTLLFTNAGMVQFKDVFLGAEHKPYRRAATAQRCVRAGGKHNDLENVGFTARHHTFFEMLGNFSFGDYFKREAIAYAWEFLTQRLGLPPERLWVTVHLSDDEAADIWLKEIGVSPERFSRLDEDNFWQMGDTGPCGPCSEIFYDHGPEVPGGPPGSPDGDLDRYIEVWNLVFMQYERDAEGNLHPLPKPSIDTGMGLERIAAVMQGVHNNYQIDLFARLVQAAAHVTGTTDLSSNSLSSNSLRVIADHIRSCAFLITDGVLPSNEGRGYVLRRIIRRALRHGHKLGATAPFFHRLVAPLAEEMGQAYPELLAAQQRVAEVLEAEEAQFARTLDMGMAVLETAFARLPEAGASGRQLPGELIFQLYDTYGFPVDLTNDIARERGWTLDLDGYETCMNEQRERARRGSRFHAEQLLPVGIASATCFRGYDALTLDSQVVALARGGQAVAELGVGDEGVILLDSTPFYGEGGGQIGDRGVLTTAAGGRFRVADCRRQGDSYLHIGTVEAGRFTLGGAIEAEVDSASRKATARHHSATHLLHAALREVLGEHVAQKGSLVDAERLRFDFAHGLAMTGEQLRAVERRVNAEILANTPVQTELMAMDAARARGAMALFGEKYGDEVRVLTMGNGFSVELCGGTHVQRTGDIGLFKLLAESGVAAGVRRIEGVAGAAALAHVELLETRLGETALALKTAPAQVLDKAIQVMELNRQQSREIEVLKRRLAEGAGGGDPLAAVQEIAGVRLLVRRIEGADARSLRDAADQLKGRLGSGVVLLAAEAEGKALLVAVVSKDLTARVKAGELLQQVAQQIGGKGGGRPDMAQGGGPDVAGLDQALASVPGWLEQVLGT